MFKDYRNSLGLLLILAGVLLGLQQLGVFTGDVRDAVFTAAFGLSAVLLFTIFLGDKRRWWAAVAALTLLGLAFTSLLDMVSPNLGDQLGGPVFMGLMAFGFILIYLVDRSMWWAIIPGGVLMSIAAVAYLDEMNSALPFEPGGILFIGMGITFLLLSLVRDNGRRLSWGIYPAIPLLIFGLMIAFGTEAIWAIVGPVMLIAGGGFLILNALRKK
jgi:hypothetical protein